LGTTFISTGKGKKASDLEQRLEQTQQPTGLPQFPSGSDELPFIPTE
jgi:hypothetical protein